MLDNELGRHHSFVGFSQMLNLATMLELHRQRVMPLPGNIIFWLLPDESGVRLVVAPDIRFETRVGFIVFKWWGVEIPIPVNYPPDKE